MYLGLVAYICNSSTWEAEAGGLQIQDLLVLREQCQANLGYTETLYYWYSCCNKMFYRGSSWKGRGVRILVTVCRCSPLWLGSHSSRSFRWLWMYCLHSRKQIVFSQPDTSSPWRTHSVGFLLRPFWKHFCRYIYCRVSISESKFGLNHHKIQIRKVKEKH